MHLDVCRRFPLPSNQFEFVYAEHLIEHVNEINGRKMMAECFRVLRPGGRLRLATPSMEKLIRIYEDPTSDLHGIYIEWSIQNSIPDSPSKSVAAVLNRLMRGWGHLFIYDRSTMRLALSDTGFVEIRECKSGISSEPSLSGLENVTRMPPGCYALESMIFEARKPAAN
jgi:predicted SAM-dependent methyltransferase